MKNRKYKDNKNYNSKIHFNHCKQWTTSEIQVLLTDNVHSLMELGELLGRSPNSICLKRGKIRKENIFNN